MFSFLIAFVLHGNGQTVGGPVNVGDPVYFSVQWANPVGGPVSRPRTPVVIPQVYIETTTLYFYNVGYNFVLQILDEDEEVVYSVSVSTGTESLVLPSDLSGEYELQLIPIDCGYYFSAYIEL